MFSLVDTIAAPTHVADRRHRFERAAREHRQVTVAIAAALASARAHLRHGREPALPSSDELHQELQSVLVALPATAPVTRSDDRTLESWSPERVA